MNKKEVFPLPRGFGEPKKQNQANHFVRFCGQNQIYCFTTLTVPAVAS
jgi:hypothetical protein